MRRLTPIWLCLAIIGLGPTAAGAQTRAARSEPPRTAAADEPHAESPTSAGGEGSARVREARENRISDSDIATAPVIEQRRTTHHVATIGGRPIGYEATAGTLTLRDDAGKPTASMFYVAYVADHARGERPRPVTFLYNGGPGSASLWLHMGSLGPVRVVTGSPGASGPAPFQIVNNDDSLLDRSDLVFLDAIGAGYSRPLGDAKGETFYGVDQDIDAFSRGITRWIEINGRWNSPKFLFGESYGTTRSAGLAYALGAQGVQLNGVLLLSSILNYGIRSPGFDQVYVSYLPSFAAAAWYHNRLANKPADLPAYLVEVRAFARGPYLAALQKGSDISDVERDAVARQMSAYTGLSVEFIKAADLRVDLNRFRKELLRDQRRVIGRYDSRFTGIDMDAAGESPEFDPSGEYITGTFVGALHSWLQDELGWKSDLAYWPSGKDVNQKWDWKHRGPGARYPQQQPDVAMDLGAAMRQNPTLKVMSLNGWYDMATPFFGTEYDLAHMQLDPTLRPNLRFAYYPSGHMVYLNTDALRQLKADVARFYDEAAPTGASTSGPRRRSR